MLVLAQKIIPKRSFSDTLKDAVDDVNPIPNRSRKYRTFSNGEMDNLHKIMIDAEKADISLQLMLQVGIKP